MGFVDADEGTDDVGCNVDGTDAILGRDDVQAGVCRFLTFVLPVETASMAFLFEFILKAR